MKKNILINKEQLLEMKKMLSEAPPIDYGDGEERMDPTLQNRLETGDFPGAGSEAFPEVPEEGIPNTFEELASTVIDRVLSLAGLEYNSYSWNE